MTTVALFGRTLAITLAAALCGASGIATAQKRGGTLVQIVQPEPPTLASYLGVTISQQVTAKVYDGLLEYGFDMKPLPSLAESWSISPDGKSVAFKLRQGVKFHDGRPFTSADVQFTIMEVLKKVHARGINTFKEVTAVETPDPQTAIFRLANPAPYMMATFSGAESPMLPKHVYGSGDLRSHPNGNRPLGTGPFKFVEWRRGEFVRLDRNPDYWRKGQPYLDRIVVRFVTDTATRTALLEKGEAHVAGFGAVPYSDVKRLSATPHLEVTTRGYEMFSPVVELTINTKRTPFDNAKVRQAVSYAANRQFIIDNVWFGFGKAATGPISSNFKVSGFYSSDVRNYNIRNAVEIANKLLDEAGYPRKADGMRFEIVHDVTPYGAEWQRFGEAFQQQLAQVGIKATLRYEDVPTWLKRVYTDYDYSITSNWLLNLGDPVLGVYRSFHSDLIKQGTVFVNGAQWSTPRTDELMNRAALEPDPAKRAIYYAEFQRLTVEAAPIVWVHELLLPTVVSRHYKDVIVSPLGVFGAFNRAWLDR